jgi:APA family basic amino acid/polyamine antiporter
MSDRETQATIPPRERRSDSGTTANGHHDGLFATKPVDALVADTEESSHQLRRAVGALDLTALGLGAIIGTGIFVVIGEAIGDAGPAIILSFVLAGVTCAFSALCFAELASTIPVAGSAYTYSYATMGELVAWIIGWDLILEYAVSVAGISVGWGQYFNDLLDSVFGITLPESIAGPPGEGGVVNLPAVFIVLAVTSVLCYGIRESARANTIMVAIKLAVLAMFLLIGVTAFNSDNLTPFTPEGTGGMVTAASVIFFAYIGFDAVSTSGEETKNPSRDLPIAIVGSLAIATVLYILVAIVAVGALPFDQLKGAEAPLATVLEEGAGVGWAASVVSFGALVAITSVVLTVLYGQTRIMFAMCRDGLMPRRFAYVHPTTRTPVYITATFGILIAIIAAFVPLTEIVKLVNIGTLFAFALVNVGVIILRRTRPDLKRGFRVPFVPLFPIIGALLCLYLMKYLDRDTWIRFAVWLVIGIGIYFGYGRRHSLLRRGQVRNPEADLN